MVPIIFALYGLAFMTGGFLFMSFINVYIVIWALGEWGVIDEAWEEQFLSTLWSWADDKDYKYLNLFNDLLAIPFEQFKFILTQVSPDDPGYHLLFVLTVYPGLYLLMMNFAVPNILMIPLLAPLYFFASEMFVDREATDQNGDKYLVPRAGLPSWWAAIYAVNSVLWGDYTYLDMDQPLEVNFAQFFQLYFWSWFMVATSFFTLFPMFIWTILGSLSLFTIFWYEVAFLSFTSDRIHIDDNAPTLPEDEWI